MPRSLILAIVVATLTAVAVRAGAQPQDGAAPAAPVEVEQFAVTADFNGDGLVDLAVGAPLENVGGTVDAGAVNVFYGTTSGLAGTSQAVLQNKVEAGDRFGAALAVGNFNADNFSDLVVGAPGEDVGATVDAGAANAFLGTPAGLTTISQTLLQDKPEAGDRFGAALSVGLLTNAAGTPNADGFTDLAVGAPGENVGATVDAGAANAFYNSTGRLPGRSSQTLLQDNVEAGDQFGASLTTGFFSGDAFSDLAVGAPGENVGARVDAGTANVFYNTSGRLPGRSSQTLLQDNVEAGDRFGAALTAGPFGGDMFYDLAVGAPAENVGAVVDAGTANVFYNTTGVLPGRSSQTLLQRSVEAGDRFGSALNAGFLSAGDFFDLVVGAPGENVGTRVDAGAANVFYNLTGRLPGRSSQTLLQDSIEAGDRFGAALSVGFFSFNDSFFDLAVGAPGEDVGATADAGAANVFYNTAGVLPGRSSRALFQGNAEAGDRFGSALPV